MKTLKLAILFCLFSIFTFAQIAQNEKEALIALYNSTDGNSWKQSWDLEQPVSKWYGITIENDNVVSIKLKF